MTLQPGQTVAVPLQVLPKVAPRIGANQTRAFTVLAGAGDQSGAPQAKASGQLIIRPPIPIWLIPVVLLMMLCLCIVGAYAYVTFCPTFSPGVPFCPAGAKPVINVFTATPNQVDKGGSVVIAWDVSNAEKVEFVAPAPPRCPPAGCKPTRWTPTRRLPCAPPTSPARSSSRWMSSCKKSPPVIQSFTANPGVITAGQTNKVVLSWTVLGATSVSIQGLSSQNLPGTGSVEVPAPTANTTYTLVATNDSGTASKT